MTRRLAEVAKKVGVSEATVSRVLNGKPGVSQTTRDAVLTALDVLGYERPTQLRVSTPGWSGWCCPNCRTRSSPRWPRWSAAAWPSRASRRCCACAGRRPVRGQLRPDAARPARVRDGLRRRGTSPRRTARTTTTSCCWSGACPGRAGQRGGRAPRLPAGLRERRRPRCRAGPRSPAVPGSPPGRPRRARPDDHMPSAAQAGRVHRAGRPGGHRHHGRRQHTMFSVEAGHASGRPPGAGRGDRDRMRQRPDRARCHPGRPPPGPVRARRCLGGGLRRFSAHDLHGSATDHGQAADRRDGPGRGEHPGPAGRGGHGRVQSELLFEPELVVRGSTARARA